MTGHRTTGDLFVIFEVASDGKFGHPTWIEGCASDVDAVERYNKSPAKYYPKTLMVARLDAFTRHDVVPTFSVDSQTWDPWSERESLG